MFDADQHLMADGHSWLRAEILMIIYLNLEQVKVLLKSVQQNVTAIYISHITRVGVVYQLEQSSRHVKSAGTCRYQLELYIKSAGTYRVGVVLLNSASYILWYVDLMNYTESYLPIFTRATQQIDVNS